jgi:hypothetical protein
MVNGEWSMVNGEWSSEAKAGELISGSMRSSNEASYQQAIMQKVNGQW